MTGDAANQSVNKEVWQIVEEHVAWLLKKGKTVVIDATFTDPALRKLFVDKMRQAGAEHIEGVIFDVPREVAHERNRTRERVVPEHVMERMFDELAMYPPSVSEGLEKLYTSDEFRRLHDSGENNFELKPR